MFVVRPDLWRHIRLSKDGRIPVWLRHDDGALNVLIPAEANVRRRVTTELEQLCTRMLVEHALAKCTKLLPLVTAELTSLMSNL